MKKNKIKIEDIEVYFQFITDCINNKQFWKTEKKRFKALKRYKKNTVIG